jgi:hypothetical protein
VTVLELSFRILFRQKRRKHIPGGESCMRESCELVSDPAVMTTDTVLTAHCQTLCSTSHSAAVRYAHHATDKTKEVQSSSPPRGPTDRSKQTKSGLPSYPLNCRQSLSTHTWKPKLLAESKHHPARREPEVRRRKCGAGVTAEATGALWEAFNFPRPDCHRCETSSEKDLILKVA